eukprot:52298-Ditylum_brightwellii.AAC.1
MIGFTAEGPLAVGLKKGTANIEELEVDEYTKGILEELKWKPHFSPKVETELRWEHIKHRYKIWNEKMSTSPLMHHLGKYKAWILPEKKETE